jgi:hypothetical protein
VHFCLNFWLEGFPREIHHEFANGLPQRPDHPSKTSPIVTMSYCPSSIYAFSDAELHGTDADPDRFNFLTFLATAQALQIEFLPIAWDVARGFIGKGGTSKIRQALINLDTSFAFKICRDHRKSERRDDPSEEKVSAWAVKVKSE